MKITKKIISEEEIQERIINLANEINNDYQEKNLIILGVLKGAFIAISDLAKNDVPEEVDNPFSMSNDSNLESDRKESVSLCEIL